MFSLLKGCLSHLEQFFDIFFTVTAAVSFTIAGLLVSITRLVMPRGGATAYCSSFVIPSVTSVLWHTLKGER